MRVTKKMLDKMPDYFRHTAEERGAKTLKDLIDLVREDPQRDTVETLILEIIHKLNGGGKLKLATHTAYCAGNASRVAPSRPEVDRLFPALTILSRASEGRPLLPDEVFREWAFVRESDYHKSKSEVSRYLYDTVERALCVALSVRVAREQAQDFEFEQTFRAADSAFYCVQAKINERKRDMFDDPEWGNFAHNVLSYGAEILDKKGEE